MKLTFYGGAKSVTGANYLLESGSTRILIDCGLTQGKRYCESSNFEAFPYDPATIDGVCVTHAHIDHTGRLPLLQVNGLRGPVYSTPPTKNFAEHLLLDSEHILGMEAQECGVPAPYTAPDIAALMGRWETKTYHEPFSIGDFQIEFYDAGHILGSASIRISDSTTAIVFSGDLGNSPAPLIKPTEPIEGVQYALIESAYGGRIHEAVASRTEKLERVIEETVKDGGTLMIPAFALERTQSLLYELNELVKRGRIPSIPIFLDSPLAIALTPIYQKYATNPLYFSRTAIAHGTEHDLFNFPGLRMTRTPAESRQIAKVSGPKVIIAGAGMSNGGRIVRHEARYLSDPKNTILFIGYQATRSRGRQILEGADTVEIDGKEIPVRCRRVEIGGYSAHADQPQLLKWLEPMRHTVQNVFIVQGEEEAAAALAQKARDELAIRATVPSPGDTVEL